MAWVVVMWVSVDCWRCGDLSPRFWVIGRRSDELVE